MRTLANRPNRFRPTVLAAIAVWIVAALSPATTIAAEQSLELGGVDVVIWTADAGGAEPLPVVVFSHGINLCATQSRFLTEALAAAGYFVVAPNHADASCGSFELEMPDPSRMALKPAMLWSEADYRDRGDDIRKVLAALARDERFRGRADLARLALVGHSLGGYTVLALAGAWPSWSLPDVKAVLALSPYSLPFRRSDGLHKLRAAVMYQGGTNDLVFTPPLRASGGAFDRSPAPKYYVEIAGAAHFAWTDGSSVDKQAMVAYAIAFLDRHVKGAAESDLLRRKQSGVAAFRRSPPAK